MTALARLYDRIGIGQDDKILLIEDEGITTISDLITRGRTAGSALVNKRLSFAVAYLTENIKRLRLAPKLVLERLLAEKEWSAHSWESFLFRRFDTSRENELINAELSERMDVDAVVSSSEDRVAEEPFVLSPYQLRKLEEKIANTNWRYNRDTDIVELCLPEVNDDDASTTNDVTGDINLREVSLSVPTRVFQPLFPHQMEGVERIISNYNGGYKGLLLGDEMGLGKTRQALIAMASLMWSSRIKRVCVLVPPGLIHTWQEEAEQVFRGYDKVKGGIETVVYSSKNDLVTRNKRLRGARLTGNPLFVIASNCLITGGTKNPLFPTGRDTGMYWDLFIIDEAHSKAKSKQTQLGSALRSKPSKLLHDAFVVLLTATPIQNQAQEFCSLLGLVSGDTEFDDFFKRNKKAIEAGQQKNAGTYSRNRAGKLIEELQDRACPYVLQRSMNEHFKGQLPSKEEHVIWLQPSKAVWEATLKIISSDHTKEAKMSDNRFCVFAVIQRLTMAAIHPFFASQVSDEDVQRSLDNNTEEDEEDELLASAEGTEDNGHMSSYLAQNRPADIMRDSTIIRVCKDLLVDLTGSGHKVLVFCRYRKPLDFLGKVLEHCGISFYRIDGKTSQQKRSDAIKSFNEESSSTGNVQTMLLTIGAGGLGLTLTGADRVILLGASWNPMVDAQAVGRAYRIGQKRPVKVYRLLMSGLIDEKVYGKQVQKEALIREVLTETGGCLKRLFDDKELSKLLTVGNRDKCEILERFGNRVVDPSKMPLELRSLQGHTKVHGIIRHDSVYRTFSNRFAGNRHYPRTKKRSSISDSSKIEISRVNKLPRTDSGATPDEQLSATARTSSEMVRVVSCASADGAIIEINDESESDDDDILEIWEVGSKVDD